MPCSIIEEEDFMDKFFLEVNRLAKKALLYEVLLSPKPGLVDTINSGAHDDMDLYTFVDSIVALDDFFYECTRIGYENTSKDYGDIFPALRACGLEAEKAMFAATNNINTHKGAIFIFAILCGAIGSLKREDQLLNVENISQRSKELSKNILKDFDNLSKDENKTYGIRQYLDHGLLGARGEAYLGFPAIFKAYKVIEESIKCGFDERTALGNGLIEIMTFLVDTNIIGRRGSEAGKFLNDSAKKVKDLGAYGTETGLAEIYKLDESFIKMNISPGGCADLAAASIFVFWVTRS